VIGRVEFHLILARHLNHKEFCMSGSAFIQRIALAFFLTVLFELAAISATAQIFCGNRNVEEPSEECEPLSEGALDRREGARVVALGRVAIARVHVGNAASVKVTACG
jgi:hypothetical protein